MKNDGDLRHLTSQQMQELLDDGLPPGEESEVREHLAVCPRCRSEMEAWSILFQGLEGLPTLEPSSAFSSEILAKLPVRRPLAARILEWMPGRQGRSPHLTTDRIQDYLDGIVSGRGQARAQAHLGACEPCATEVERWQQLYGSLRSLERIAPSPGFAGRVMARVRVPAPTPVPWIQTVPGRIWAGARKLLPRTRQGWAVAGGIASAPTITAAALFYQVFSHPLLSLGSFSTYAYWKVSAFLGTLFTSLADHLVESVAMFRAYTLVETVLGSPVLVGMGGLVFSLLCAGALWVLYRNLITAPSAEGHHARARV